MRSSSSIHPIRRIRRFAAAMVLAVSVLSCSPHSAMASSDEDADHYDARVQGYDPNVELKTWGVGGCWMLLILMGVGCVAVIFKDSKRSHLD
jgi:hypothetical protein